MKFRLQRTFEGLKEVERARRQIVNVISTNIAMNVFKNYTVMESELLWNKFQEVRRMQETEAGSVDIRTISSGNLR